MKKIVHNQKVFLAAILICLIVVSFFIIKEDRNSLQYEHSLPESSKGSYFENAYLDMPLEQLIEIVVIEEASALKSDFSFC